MSEDSGIYEVIEKVKEQGEENLIRLSSGVVLRGRKVSASLLIDVITSSKRPKPPTYFNKQMGRNMENLDDPDYVEQVQAYKYEQAGAMVTAMILMGTEIVSLPGDMEGPHPIKSEVRIQKAESKKKKPEEEDKKTKPVELIWPEWIQEYELLGLPMKAQNESWRYLTWVKYKAAPEDSDLQLIQEVVGRLSGVREADAKAAEEFSGRNEKNR